MAVLVFIGAAIYLGGVGGIILFFWTTLVWCAGGGQQGVASWMDGRHLPFLLYAAAAVRGKVGRGEEGGPPT